MRDNVPTSWEFPPALNSTFREAYQEETRRLNNTALDRGVEALIVAAVHNLTQPQLYDQGFERKGFGEDDAIVRKGDMIEVSWDDTSARNVQLNCVVCSTGTEGGSIKDACGNYTKTKNTSNRLETANDLRAGDYYTMPSLESYFPLPSDTCALCVLTLYDVMGYVTDDYSVPFPVLQESGTTAKRFNSASPTGVDDPTLPNQTILATGQALMDPQIVETNKPNVGMIVGVVVGVLGGVVLLAVGAWFLWKRKKAAKTKVVKSSGSSTSEQGAEGAGMGPRDVHLQRVQGVSRRPDTSTSDVPPPYHEVVRG